MYCVLTLNNCIVLYDIVSTVLVLSLASVSQFSLFTYNYRYDIV